MQHRYYKCLDLVQSDIQFNARNLYKNFLIPEAMVPALGSKTLGASVFQILQALLQMTH